VGLGWECMVCKQRFKHYVAAHTRQVMSGTRDAAGISHGIRRNIPCQGEVVKLIVARTGDSKVGDKGRLVIPERIPPPDPRMVQP
jgi:hypothetical protein